MCFFLLIIIAIVITINSNSYCLCFGLTIGQWHRYPSNSPTTAHPCWSHLGSSGLSIGIFRQSCSKCRAVIDREPRDKTRHLKGLRHEHFAVYVNFVLKADTKCSCETIRKISRELYQGELAQIFHCFNPFPHILAIPRNRR